MSNLLEKASILLTPTAYSDGTLHSVKPVQTFGSELVSQPNFQSQGSWFVFNNNQGTIGGGTATIIGDGSNAFAQWRHNFSVSTSKKYELIVTISETNNNIEIAAASGASDFPNNNETQAGTHTFRFTPTSTTFVLKIGINNNANGNATLTFASLKEVTDGDFDFTRGTAATRVNSQGLIENVQILSGELVVNGDFEDGDSNWDINAGWSISDGRANIDTDNGTENFFQIGGNLVVGRKYKLSLNANLSVGSIKFESGEGDNFIFTGDVDSHIFVADIPSPTFRRQVAPTRGYIDNISIVEITDDTNLPRIDYSPYTSAGTCGHWLLEPQSTNTATYSNDFTQGDIFSGSSDPSLTDAILTANQGTAPDGTNTAQLLKDDNDGGVGQAGLNYFAASVVSDDFNTVSIFAKKSLSNDLIFIQTGGFDTDANGRSWFNIQNGTVGTVQSQHTAKIEDYGNGWYRCSITFKTTTDVVGSVRVNLASTDNSTNITRDGTNGVLLWGLQAEADASRNFATSYIPTSGSTVTRNKDLANNSGDSSLINSPEGVLYAEIAALANDGTTRALSLSSGSSSNRVFISYSSTNNRVSCFGSTGGATQFSMGTDITDATDFIKVALKYKLNDIALFINGSEVNTDTSATLPSADTFTSLQFNSGGGASEFFGKTKCVAVFKEALDNDELECLTGSGFDSFTALAEAGSYTII